MQKLHLDTDLGGDIDDLCALAMVLNWPEVELLAVTTVAEQQGQRAGYVRHALRLAQRPDIPVAAGADIAQHAYRVWQGLPNAADYWPEPIPPARPALDEALALLARSIEQGATIVAIGAFTNLALLEQRQPGILRQARLYLMGGYVFPPRAGFPQWGPEIDFNVQVDAASAQLVITHSNPTFVTLAVSVETSLRHAYLPRLRQAGPLAQLIARQAETFARDENHAAQFGQTCAGVPDDTINFQHDALACAIALGWREGVEIRELPLRSEIKDAWLCHTPDARGKPTRVVTKINGDRFNEFWLETVTRRI
ncbi:MAG: nucleoside hydrolase [Acidobacteria bacterium]|nr:nucleoside hydrolase [Acidobacteriota bacterium]MBI3426661.1 nucleoside hydrolase [Acidobacteriota bacterium]